MPVEDVLYNASTFMTRRKNSRYVSSVTRSKVVGDSSGRRYGREAAPQRTLCPQQNRNSEPGRKLGQGQRKMRLLFAIVDPGALPFSFFVGSIAILWVFLVSRWKNLLTSFRAVYAEGTISEHEGTSRAGTIAPNSEPHVTVQICTYNEGEVVPETIAHACTIDWPEDKLHIQILDDSTELESIAIVERSVDFWRRRGVDVERLCRPDRVGFKAGNLRHNFDRAVGEFVAYFDADHRSERDFLRNVIPYFFDQDGNLLEKVALVQTPWGYYNTHQNILTECGKSIANGARTKHVFFLHLYYQMH